MKIGGITQALAEETIQLKIREHVEEFETLCPTATRLRSSEIKVSLISRPEGSFLSLTLRELPQLELDLKIKKRSSAPHPMLDGFTSELANLHQEVAAMQSTIFSALSSDIDPSDLRHGDARARQVKFIRVMARKRQFPASFETASLFTALPMAPKFPHGTTCTLSATIESILPGGLKLKNAKLLAPVPSNLLDVTVPSTILMRRPRFAADAELFEKFGELLDSQNALRCKAVVAFDSATGQPSELEWVGFFTVEVPSLSESPQVL